MLVPSQKLSNLQLELLKVFSRNISDEELLEVRRMLAKYFMQKAVKSADNVWSERGYSEELMKKWMQDEK
jgi:hypothetical protein